MGGGAVMMSLSGAERHDAKGDWTQVSSSVYLCVLCDKDFANCTTTRPAPER